MPELAAILVPLAHAGNLTIDLPVFLGPVVVLAAWLLAVARGGRKRADRHD